MILEGILSGQRDGEVEETTERDIRAFLAEKHPALDADAILATPPSGRWKFRDAWPPAYDEVMLTIPVGEIEDSTEEVSVVSPKES
jgi:hypothetical protein